MSPAASTRTSLITIFNQWAKSENLTDETLKKAIDEIENGLHDGNLGSSLYKKKVSMHGKGKCGSYRTLVALKHEKNAFFVYGFAKNVRANIDANELSVYKSLAKALLNSDGVQPLNNVHFFP